jgi:hypothetical protein
MLYTNLKNNIIIKKHKIEYVIRKISKYVQIGGEEQLEKKMKNNAVKIADMIKIKKDLEDIDVILNNFLNDVDDLIKEIDNTHKAGKNIKKENAKILEEQYKKIKKLLSIDDNNNINYYDSNQDYEEKFIRDLKFLYFGLFDESSKLINSIKTKKDFDENILKTLEQTIVKVKSVTKIANKYIENINKNIKNQAETIENLYFFKDIKQIDRAKVKIDRNIDSIIEPKKIENIKEKEKIIPVNLTEIVKEGHDALKLLKINSTIYTFGKKDGETSTNLDIFFGGNIDIVSKLNDLISSLDECERTLEKISEIREKHILLKKQSDDFVKFIIEMLNKNENHISIYTHVNKNILEKYLKRIKQIINPDNEYYIVLKILDKGLTTILEYIKEDDIIQIDQLTDNNFKNLFVIFNNFHEKLD